MGGRSTYTLDSRGLPVGYNYRPEYEATPRETKAGLERGEIVLDVRTPEELSVARLPGALHIPMGELEQRLDELEEFRATTIHVICHMGVRSLRATLMLRQLGFPGARSVAGGIDLWAADIDQTIARY